MKTLHLFSHFGSSKLPYNVLQISEGKAFKNKNLIFKINIIMKTKMSNYRKCFALAYVLLVAVFLVGCEKEPATKANEYLSDKPVYEIVTGVKYRIVVIDSCEYLFGTDGGAYNGGYFLSHKGNCKFCLARHAK